MGGRKGPELAANFQGSFCPSLTTFRYAHGCCPDHYDCLVFNYLALTVIFISVCSTSKLRRRRSFGSSWGAAVPDDLGNVIDKTTCRLRYQQSPVDVYAHFMASDHNSGRVINLINRKTWLRVTDLVLPLLRVSDPRIATLNGRILQGRSMGRTEVQVCNGLLWFVLWSIYSKWINFIIFSEIASKFVATFYCLLNGNRLIGPQYRRYTNMY